MRKCFCFIAILLILIPVDVFCRATYDAKKKLLSIKSEGRLLSKVLSEVSVKTGIDIYINPAVDKKVFVNIESQSLENAIKRIIKPLNNAIIFKGNSIVAVKIFEKSEGKSSLKITPGITYSKSTSPPIGQGFDINIQTMEEFEDATKGKRREIGETSIGQGFDINIQSIQRAGSNLYRLLPKAGIQTESHKKQRSKPTK